MLFSVYDSALSTILPDSLRGSGIPIPNGDPNCDSNPLEKTAELCQTACLEVNLIVNMTAYTGKLICVV